jgi:hypothetical protein
MSKKNLCLCKGQKHVPLYFRRGGVFCFRGTKDLPDTEQRISTLVSQPVG